MLLLSLQPGLRAPLKAYLGVYIYFEIDEGVESRPAKNVICLFCSGDGLAHGSGGTHDSRQGHRKVLHAVTRETWAVIVC